MKNLKKTSMGALAMLLIVLLAGLPAFAATEGSQKEVNIAGMAVIGGRGREAFLGHIGFGDFAKGFGFELGADMAPLYKEIYVLFDGAFVLNPFSDKPVSPVLRIGAVASTLGWGSFEIGVGLRLHYSPKFGLRVEYNHIPAANFDLVVFGVFFNI